MFQLLTSGFYNLTQKYTARLMRLKYQRRLTDAIDYQYYGNIPNM